jgi:glycosyltransferase involved in cell wall biosynthesis
VDSLKILKLSYEFPPVGGGGSKVAYGLSSCLTGMGHSIDLVTMAFGDLPKQETVNGIRVYRVPSFRKDIDRCHPHEMAAYLARAMSELRRLCRAGSYDLVHCHFILPDGLLGLWLRHKLGVPLVVTAHGSDVPGYNPDRFQLWHKAIAPFWRRSTRAIDAIVCPSEYLEGLILSGEPQAHTVTIPNGYDVDKFDPGRPRKKRILVLTRMLERKGVQDVLRALQEPGIDYELDIVGTGAYLDELKKLDAELGTGAIFHGWLDNDSDELRELLETASIFVFPSHAENFPLVLLEAMAAGAAIITTNQTGCKEVVGDTAIKVPPGQPAAIREALEKLVADQELRDRLAREARARLEQNFSWQSVTNSYLDTFRELVAKNDQ